jgi:hypothetical protein
MSLLVWATMGIAIWHFAVFVPDHFWGGIIGAFLASTIGAVVFGLIVSAGQVDDASLITSLEAIPGAVGGLAVAYYIGLRREGVET